MNPIQTLAGILILAMPNCKPNKPIDIDYCDMLTKDQSYVNLEEKDEQIRMENNKKREELFVKNYEQIIQLTKQEGFPNIDRNNMPQDSCKYWGVTATLIHMAQAKPEIFFSEDNITLFESEIKKGNLEPKNLTPAFRISFITNEFCEDLREPINKAVDVWKMKTFLNSEPKFKKCN